MAQKIWMYKFSSAQCDVVIKERITDYLSVYTVGLVAILLALLWVEENNKNDVLIASDSKRAFHSNCPKNMAEQKQFCKGECQSST